MITANFKFYPIDLCQECKSNLIVFFKKTISRIDHINRLKDKNIISIDTTDFS